MLKTMLQLKDTKEIGYLNQKDAVAAMEREDNMAILKARFGRCDEISKMRKIVDTIKPGLQIRALCFKYTYEGTVLGYARREKGWVMAMILARSGKVKEVFIDRSQKSREIWV